MRRNSKSLEQSREKFKKLKLMKKLKLANMEHNSLAKKQMVNIKGGDGCSCACWYEGRGGSSTADNNAANTAGGLGSVDENGNPIVVITASGMN